MRKLVLIIGTAAVAVLVAAPVAQAAPSGDKINGSGVWRSPDTNPMDGEPDFGVPTMNVSANEKGPASKSKFTFDYKNPAGETVYLVQGKVVDFEVTGTTACLVGQVTKEQGQDPRLVSPPNSRF